MIKIPESIADRLSGPFSSYGTRISKEEMTAVQVHDSQKYCHELIAEISRLQEEVEQVKGQLSQARKLCHHEGDQGSDCIHCGECDNSQYD